jgi:sodium-dependent dicarboxylate transporter 2/3/5
MRRVMGLVLGPAVALVLLLLPVSGLSTEAARLAAVVAWVIIWWVSEAVPLPVTALLGPALMVVLEVATPKEALSPFGDPIIFLFLGGFLLARGMTVHSLDRRIALSILSSRWVGGRPTRVLAGFALLAAGLSMWLSNTATTAMLYPIALGVLGSSSASGDSLPHKRTYATGLLLACAYGASIGGVGTPIGTPPNVIAMGQLSTLAGVQISFLSWMGLTFPVGAAMLGFALLYIRLVFRPAAGSFLDVEGVQAHREGLGPGVAAAIGGSQSALARGLTVALPEAVVALLAATLLFILPLDWKTHRPTLTWKEGAQIDWGTLLLFGGGLSLGSAMFRTGLAASLGSSLVESTGARSLLAITVLFSVMAVFLTEVTSNTATATMLVPLAIAAAQAAGVDPVPPALGCALGCSMAFMLPVATPPNAIVYGSGRVPITHMVRSGLWMNLAACALIPALLLAIRWVTRV